MPNIEDHPHACGDKHMRGAGSARKTGSSPRVWGQEHTRKLFSECKRIIPTRMGTSFRSSSDNVLAWDHPHAYGDKGKFASQSSFFVRIIPTRMGTRIYHGKDWKVEEDHPHAYGDKCFN